MQPPSDEGGGTAQAVSEGENLSPGQKMKTFASPLLRGGLLFSLIDKCLPEKYNKPIIFFLR